jgi:hypothetical protein
LVLDMVAIFPDLAAGAQRKKQNRPKAVVS